jgi:DNA-binding transcriptional regulator YiaG
MKSNASSKPSRPKRKREKEVTFDASLLLESLRAHADALEGKRKLTMRESTLRLAPPAPAFTPQDIIAIRDNLHVSQPVFASLLNVPVGTARSWEQGTRFPSGAALRLLEIFHRAPKAMMREVAPELASLLPKRVLPKRTA